MPVFQVRNLYHCTRQAPKCAKKGSAVHTGEEWPRPLPICEAPEVRLKRGDRRNDFFTNALNQCQIIVAEVEERVAHAHLRQCMEKLDRLAHI